MNNGVHPNGDEGNVDDLARAYRDLRLQFRHHPDCRIPFMKWQQAARAPINVRIGAASSSYAL